MAGKIRVYRQRIRAVTTIKKSTRAMELVAASRIRRAQERSQAATPYARELTRAVSALATYSHVDHPITTERANPRRAAVLVISSDRGLAGAYSSSVLREGERLAELLRGEGKEVVPYVCGRKAVAYYRFRNREIAGEWTGFSDGPSYDDARAVGQELTQAFLAGSDEGGVDEIHIVYTQFVSMMTQRPEVIRLMPLEVVEGEEPPAEEDVLPLYEFEPSAAEVLDALLPRYVDNRIYHCMLQAAASELAARQRAMKSATDNAEELIRTLTREANQARQAEITQEISEIVGGASALAESSAGSE
ncbi:F0F1 ATP synthase subunit gamma [Actinopolymorpha singaporensis]|uniref:ATP synthase gamma chain n=1 Tax=Actinopolymorpha singaporensis TaxID=117157 RepID=A0A1H1YJA2_9ACTN|nr:F0F1 ATP synthase subunit gamma [Actinopolymorpha singaporensis]SDT21441.1 ATP synthase F1 subcomplex gamma subunit [Actinopolymorpha singaporensis]